MWLQMISQIRRLACRHTQLACHFLFLMHGGTIHGLDYKGIARSILKEEQTGFLLSHIGTQVDFTV